MPIDELIEWSYQQIKKSKHHFMSLDEIREMLKEKLGDDYTSEIGIIVKDSLTTDERLDFFREGIYINGNKFYHCAGNWLAIRGEYSNPLEAKFKIGMQSWQTSKDDDGA